METCLKYYILCSYHHQKVSREIFFVIESILDRNIYIKTHYYMARRSNKSVQEILGQQQSQPTGEFITLVGVSYDDKELDRKITLVTEGFTTTKYRELILRDRTRLSKKNTLTACDYIIDMKREINPSLNTIRTTIQFFSGLCKCVKNKRFEEMTRDGPMPQTRQ